MKTDSIGLAVGAAALAADKLAIVLFGVPIGVMVGAFGGALFGATYFPADARISRPWSVVVNSVAGIILAAVVGKLSSLEGSLLAGVAFIISAAPVLIFRWLITRITGKPHEPL